MRWQPIASLPYVCQWSFTTKVRCKDKYLFWNKQVFTSFFFIFTEKNFETVMTIFLSFFSIYHIIIILEALFLPITIWLIGRYIFRLISDVTVPSGNLIKGKSFHCRQVILFPLFLSGVTIHKFLLSDVTSLGKSSTLLSKATS